MMIIFINYCIYLVISHILQSCLISRDTTFEFLQDLASFYQDLTRIMFKKLDRSYKADHK